MQKEFRDKYGPWALVAGASDGLGAEFARQIAARGVNLFLVARRAAMLDRLADEARTQYGVQARTSALDLASRDSVEAILGQTESLEIGLLVYNAALSAIGPFLTTPVETHLREIETNVRTPLRLAYALGGAMRTRRRGGVILLSSLSALQGTALISNYTATKAYNLILAEGLWEELRREGVDVLASCPGAVRTPNYLASTARRSVPSITPQVVVSETLHALGQAPSVVPAFSNKLQAWALQRLLPRRLAVALMGRVLRSMYE